MTGIWETFPARPCSGKGNGSTGHAARQRADESYGFANRNPFQTKMATYGVCSYCFPFVNVDNSPVPLETELTSGAVALHNLPVAVLNLLKQSPTLLLIWN